MVYSMTAFSRQEQNEEWGSLALELRSVNHRYLDLSLRMPEDFRSLEPVIREKISARLSRGKVELNLRFQRNESSQGQLVFDHQLVENISHASREIDQMLYNPAPISSLEVLRWPGVIQSRELDKELLGETLLQVLDRALDDLCEARLREGEKLAELIQQRCIAMGEVIEGVMKTWPEIAHSWRERLLAKLEEAKVSVDENRLEQELVMLAQKADIEEEIDRLRTHITEVQRVLGDKKPVGRRLDFLMQELNREANTLGSKSTHTETTRASVDLKVLIEQMREQVQNIE